MVNGKVLHFGKNIPRCLSHSGRCKKMEMFLLSVGEKAAETTEVSNLFVVLMGVGTVFVGLICIIILCLIVGLFCRLGGDKKDTTPVAAPAQNTAPAVSSSADLAPEKRREIIAAVSAALAEELGTDVSAIRIHSFKKI